TNGSNGWRFNHSRIVSIFTNSILPRLFGRSQRHRHIHQLPAAKHGDQRLLTRAMTLDECQERILRRRLFAIDGDNRVRLAAIDLSLVVGQDAAAMRLADNAEAMQPRSLGWAARIKRHNLQPAVRDEYMLDPRVR